MAAEPKPIICLMGATATGKTQLALELSQHLPVDIVSVDSMMVYRYLDIGTAKPEKSILKNYPHQLVDVCDPWQRYSVAQWMADTWSAISKIHQQGRWPLLVGGTMMYFDRLQRGLSDFPVIDQAVREQVVVDRREWGLRRLYDELAAQDPLYARTLSPNDTQRIMRALEVVRQTGQPFSSFNRPNADAGGMAQGGCYINLALVANDRAALRQKIGERFALMERAGLWDEVDWCCQHPRITVDLPAMKAVGYRQLWLGLTGGMTRDEARFRAVVATCQLAKRQHTWLNRWPEIKRYDTCEALAADGVAADIRAQVDQAYHA